MTADAIDRAVRAQGAAPLKPGQLRALVLAARRAWAAQTAAGLADGAEGFDAWRRAALHDVTGPAAPDSFRALTQRDFPAALGYFRGLAGEGAPAPRDGAGDERRRALFALEREERALAGAFGGAEGARRYADALLSRIHRTDRGAATARQLWAAAFTLRSRARKKRA